MAVISVLVVARLKFTLMVVTSPEARHSLPVRLTDGMRPVPYWQRRARIYRSQDYPLGTLYVSLLALIPIKKTI